MLKRVLMLSLFVTAPIFAELSLPNIFGDGMVLQEGKAVCLWGQANPSAEIMVQANWDSQEYLCKADKAGNWKVFIKTPEASFEPRQLVVKSGPEQVVYKDILIGQVWFCSGQSNMQFTLSRCESADTEIPVAKFPNIRYFKVKSKYSKVPLDNVSGSWKQCSPETVEYFSGAAYYFGKNLYQKLNKPIGLIDASWGGTPIESWMNPDCLKQYPEYASYLKQRSIDYLKKYEGSKRYYERKLKEWQTGKISEKPKDAGSPRYQNMPLYCYNGMVHPLKQFAIAGVIWYQGEANTPYSEYYYKAFPLFIDEWRKVWDNPELPFYYVQLAASTGYKIGVAKVREAQFLTLGKVKNVGMAVTMDIGDATNHHPKNKRDVGYRLALWASRDLYGFDDIVPSGPLYRDKKIESDKIRVFFDYAENGLMAKNGELTDFQICGADGKFYSGRAVIDGNTVLVSSDKVLKPVDVSFAWCEYAKPNFYNKQGLPASPFNTYSMKMLNN